MPQTEHAATGHFTSLFTSIAPEEVQVGSLPNGAAGANVASSSVLSSIAAVFTSPLELGLNLFMPPLTSQHAAGNAD